jgi:hypothetical protein
MNLDALKPLIRQQRATDGLALIAAGTRLCRHGWRDQNKAIAPSCAVVSVWRSVTCAWSDTRVVC